MITTFKYGFEYKNIKYAWKNKKLFRLPYTKDKRSYNIKEIPIYCFKTTLVANIQKNKLTINKMKLLTKNVYWQIESFENSDCPF